MAKRSLKLKEWSLFLQLWNWAGLVTCFK
jgi:hypothetical protein